MAWWQALGIAPLEVAHGLWQKTQSGRALNKPLPPLTKPPQMRTERTVDGRPTANLLTKAVLTPEYAVETAQKINCEK
jgi:hypothetical protein